MRYCLIVLSFVLNREFVCSQTYSYRNYNSENGLASSTVYVAYQDTKGYLWFGTEEGVSRFDGRHFKNYTTGDGLADNDILRIYEDSYNRVWFLAFNGHLSYYSLEDNTIHNETTDPYLKKAYSGSGIYYALEDKKGRIWFCTLEGKIILLKGNNVFVFNMPGDDVPYVVCADEDADGNIVIFHFKGRYIFDENTRTLKSHGTGISPLSTYFRSPSGAIYFTSTNYIYAIEKGKFKKILPISNTEFAGYEIITITDDKKYLYLSTRSNGVIVLDKQNHKLIRKYPFKESVFSTTIDSEQNIWFLTRGAGAYMLPYQNKSTELFSSGSFNNDEIFSITQLDSATFLIGGSHNNVFLLNRSSVREIQLRYSKNKLQGRVVDLQKDRENNIWACSEGGVYKCSFSNATGAQYKIIYDTLLVRSLNVSFCKKNRIFYSITTGIRQIEKEEGGALISSIPFKGIFENKRTYGVFFDNTGLLYISNIDGFHVVKGDTIINYAHTNNLLSHRIVGITQTPDSTLILATDGNGLLFFKYGRIINSLNVGDGLISSICRKVICSGSRVLVCTNKGLSSFDYRNNRVSAIQNINNFNGLVYNNVKDVLSVNERLYIVTTKGLCILNQGGHREMETPPHVYLTSVTDKSNREFKKDSIRLVYTNNLLRVRFTAVTFSNPANILYQYSLGKERNWIASNTDEVVFSDLPPGSYTLFVRAKKIDSDWSEPEILNFNVIPPFYKTWWFTLLIIVACSVLLILTVIYLYRRSQRMLLIRFEKRNALNDERNRISADMHDDVGSDLSKIYVTAEYIKSQLKVNHKMYVHLEKLNRFAMGARKKMDDIIWALNPENDNLGNLLAYINRYALDYFSDTDIAFKLNNLTNNSDLKLNAKERRNIFMVIKELCTNTLKHSGAGNFQIEISIENSRVVIKASDDGIGLPEKMYNAFGNGFINMQKRAKEINAIFTVVTGIKKGAQFILEVPYED